MKFSGQWGRRALSGIAAGATGLLLAGLGSVSAMAQDDGVVLDVNTDAQVVGAPGDVVEISGTVNHTGTEDMVGGTVDFEVPEGAEIIGVAGQELEEGTERPAEGCALASPQHLVCGTQATLPAGASNEATFEVQIADDAAAGELGVAVTSVAGDNGGEASAETVITVAGTDEPTEEPTTEPTEEPTEEPTAEPTEDPDENGDEAGTESGDDDDLPDTGASTSALLAAAGLLLVGGAAVALRARRS